MIEKAREAIAISPDAGQNTPSYFNVVWGYISLGRPTEAEQALQQAVARAPDQLLRWPGVRSSRCFMRGHCAIT